MVLLALRAVLQLLPADAEDVERLAVEIALQFVPETARALATAVVLVAAAICVPDVPEVAPDALTNVLKDVLQVVNMLVLRVVRIHA